jgi:hypothetical protein
LTKENGDFADDRNRLMPMASEYVKFISDDMGSKFMS